MNSQNRPVRIRRRSSARKSVMDPDNAREINGAINRAFDKKRNGAAAVARILVLVDDDPDQQAIAQVLAGGGHEVESVHDGKQALEWLDRNPADLLVTAITMSEASGLVVLATHRPRSPRVKFILLADARESKSTIEAAKRLGADRVLVKPVDTRELLACVREVVGES